MGLWLSQPRSTLVGVSVVHLPDELVERLATEAARRGVSVEELSAELLAAALPGDDGGAEPRSDALEAFIGSGDSGDPSWASRPAGELRAEAYRRRQAG